MEDGIILLDTDRGKQFGFTSKLFSGYLWKEKDSIIISTIFSLQSGKGYLKTLFDQISSQGYNIIVPTPFARMEMICNKYGMKHEIKSTEQGPCFCMVFTNPKTTINVNIDGH